MKTLIFFISCILLTGNLVAQDVHFEWAGQVPRFPAAGLESYLIGLDKARNLYTAGNFEYTNDFDPGPGVYNLTSVTPDIDAYITKLDMHGKLVWAKSFGGIGAESLYGFAVDAAGNLYCAGYFRDIVDFDPGPGVFNLDGGASGSGYLVKFDTDGNLKWVVKTALTSSGPLALDPSGNIYVAGFFSTNQDIDPGPGVITTAVLGSSHGCIRKFDNDGNLVWAKIILNEQYFLVPTTIAADKYGNCYTAGYFMGKADFDPGVNTLILDAGSGSTERFLVKLDMSGNLKWAKKDIGYTIAVDDKENVYNYYLDISKLDKDGNLLWTKSSGGYPLTENGTENPNTIFIDSAGGIYNCGSFQGTTDFDPGPGTYNMTVLPSSDLNDGFIRKLDANGNFQWAKQLSTPFRDIFYGLLVDNSGGVYTTGIFNSGYADFDPDPGEYLLGGVIGTNFTWKLSPCPGNTDSTVVKNACTSYTLNNTRYDSSGKYYQVIKNASGCDSVITLNLTISKPISDTAVTACGSFTWNNHVYTNTGTFTDTLTSVNGCDSIAQLHLLINAVSRTNVTTSVCKGQSVDGYSTAGVYIDTLVAANGCDSIRTLTLSVVQPVFTQIAALICEGRNYNGHHLAGTYIDTLRSVNGCDSITTLTLLVNPKKSTNIDTLICTGSSFRGHTSSGTYTDSLLTYLGCDSIVTLHLTVDPGPIPALGADRSLCLNEDALISPGNFSSYQWQDGSTNATFRIKATGTYWVIVTNANNCRATDSLLVLSINMLPANFLPAKKLLCAGSTVELQVSGYKNYAWSTGDVSNTVSFDTVGTYYLTVTDYNNCKGSDTIVVARDTNCIPISLPRAFTPNRDGINDNFKPIINQFITAYSFTIFNRYGEKIFETNNAKVGWDGTFKSIDQPMGSYIYRMKFKGTNGFLYDKAGTVLLIR